MSASHLNHLYPPPSHPLEGLRYEDLLNEDEKEVAEALSLADPSVQTARTRRIKRAIDLSYKRKSLQDYAPDMELDMWKREIYVDVEKIRARDQEYAQLNANNKM
jgi:ubiquinol-cytochrome c reductase subunit 7